MSVFHFINYVLQNAFESRFSNDMFALCLRPFVLEILASLRKNHLDT